MYVVATSGYLNGSTYRVQTLLSCDASASAACDVLFTSPSSKNLPHIAGPVVYRNRLLFQTVSWQDHALLSCDPTATRSVDDCSRVAVARWFWSFAAMGTTRIVGVVRDPKAPAHPGDRISSCRVDSGRCDDLGTLRGRGDQILFTPAIGRPAEGVPEVPRVFVTVPDAKQVWSCGATNGSGCTVLATFSSRPTSLAATGGWLYVGTKTSVERCDGLIANRCSPLMQEGGVSQLAAYGDDILTGTWAGTTRTKSNRTGIEGSLLLHPIGSGSATTLVTDRPGGVATLALLQEPVLTTRVERYTPRGSSVKAYGSITLDPPPTAGATECALVHAELPVTCTSQYADGQTVTLTARPGPKSKLNTWLGDAEQCNEPGGPGTPPANTCTITVTGQTTLAVAGFRPE